MTAARLVAGRVAGQPGFYPESPSKADCLGMAMQTATPTRYHTEFVYHDRTSKATYIAWKYAPILGGRVLDVGCDAAVLRDLVGRPEQYMGVDIRPGADLVVDLDRDDLPLPDQSFDTVVCTDVLEHLERCHAVFDELCRVSRERVIVSLPNPLRCLMLAIAGGSAGRAKFYGLPVDRPADRHRWFFGYEEAVEFVTQRGRRLGFEVEQIDAEHHGCPGWVREGMNLLASENAKAGTMWCVLRRV